MAVNYKQTATRIDYSIDYKDVAKREEGIIYVCTQVGPAGWESLNKSDFEIVTIQGGITNLLFAVTKKQTEKDHNDTKISKETVLVRLYGTNTEVLIDREVDCRNFELLSDKKFGPHLFGLFTNGRVEEFLEAEPLEPNMMGQRTPVDFSKLISTELAKMNSLEMPGDKNAQLWPMLEKFEKIALSVDFDKDDAKRDSLRDLNLKDALTTMKEYMAVLPSSRNENGQQFIEEAIVQYGADSPQLYARKFLFDSVFCHNDLLAGNILILKGTETVRFIDFEYGCYNFRGFDIANHFCEYAGFDFNLEKWYPDDASQSYFLRHYLLEWLALPGNEDENSKLKNIVNNSEDWDIFTSELIVWINKFANASHLLWGIWAVVQAGFSPIDFDFLEYAALRFAPLKNENSL